MRNDRSLNGWIIVLMALLSGPNHATDLVPTRLLGLDPARDIATAAVAACRKEGYQVAVVVTDRSGDPVVIMRDVFVSKYMVEIARNKANAVVMSNSSSGELRTNMARIREELNELDGVLLMEGGLPIRVNGGLIGAVGVSGAPGGDKDEACARAGIEAVQERLDFAD
ncbi:MAG: heme-binding protein [Gammaproteobacteria bacterium]|nr:heme-binding protein [Gammaproteobacteria bacterium]